MQEPEAERVGAEERLPHDARRDCAAGVCGIRNHVLHAVQLVAAVGRAAVDEDLRALELDARVEQRRVTSEDAAVAERFLGSPTLRVDGVDVDPGAADREDFGLRCRLYATGDGLRGVPEDRWIRAALRRAREAA